MNKINPLILLLLFITSCSEARIDASSDEELTASIEKVNENLSEDEQQEFEESLMFIAFQNLDFSGLFQSDFSSEDFAGNYINSIKSEIDGKSASEIISLAETLRNELEEEQKQQALQEIVELEEKQRNAELASEELSKFEVLRSRFYMRKDLFQDQPIIEMTVRNDTDFAISRAYFQGTYATPGRQIPWLVEIFNYSISGGLEPGEEQSWNLAPNMFSEWGELEERSDAILTVEVIKLDGPENEELFDATGLTSFEEERLEELKMQYVD